MAIQRVEVITGHERRRRFSDEDKQQLVEEAFQPGVRATDVARRHGMDVSLLYRWRRLLFGRQPRLPAFTPIAVVADSAGEEPAPGCSDGGAVTPPQAPDGFLEIEFPGGTRVRIIGAVDASMVARVLGVLSGRSA